MSPETPPEMPPAVPIHQVVAKIRQDCNLACPNCYVYYGADQSWKDKPQIMGDAVLEQMGVRVAEHAETHDMESIQVILHGGEPTMNGPQYIARAAERLRAQMPKGRELSLGMQTNGVLLTPRWLDMLAEHKVKVGVSLDGPAEINDARRPFKNNRGSFARVDRALRLLNTEKYRQVFSGILCTIDASTDPAAIFAALAVYESPSLDFLIPHATWDHPPARAPENTTPLGDWLVRAFDLWAEGALGETKVRIFESTIGALITGKGTSEQIGGTSPVAVAVVESDGTYEQTDSLKVARPGAPETGLDIFRHSLDDVLAQPEVRARQLGIASLSQTCQGCELVTACAGGHYTHRYRTGNGYDNPSVYCDDMKVYIPHARELTQQLLDRLAAEQAQQPK